MEQGVDIEIQKQDYATAWIAIIVALPYSLFLIAIVYYLLKVLGTTKLKNFEVLKNNVNVTFDDVAGMTTVKEEVRFAVETLKDIKKIKRMGGRPTKGIILEGPPGTGKTLIAKAIAGEANVPFISASGSDFEEMFVGLGAARVRSLWYLAELNAPCVLFIDEIDAMGMNRERKGAEVYSQTLNALLAKMDGLIGTEGIMVIAATNRVKALDPALTRSGRFDKTIHIGLPDNKEDRKAIMEVHLKNKKISDDFDKDKAVSMMFGMSGADIENTLNEAVLCSLLNNREGVISTSDIEEAAMKLLTNGVLKDKISDKDRYIASVHEAGHTLMNLLLNRQVFKMSVQAYTTGVGGVTIREQDSKDEDHLKSKDELEKDLMVLLAGGIAEELVLGQRTQGWSNDLERVTDIVTQMYANWGMLDNKLVLKDRLLEADIEYINNYIKTLISCTSHDLFSHTGSILKLANAVKEKETLYREDIDELLKDDLN